MKNQNKGITLISLVISIIVLLILASVTIAQLTGDNGLLQKAGDSVENSKYANAEEKVKLAVMASYGDGANLDKQRLKENINKIEGLYEEVEEITYNLTINVDNYDFEITELGQVITVGKNEQLPENTPDTNAGELVALKKGWYTQTPNYVEIPTGQIIKTSEKVASVYGVSDGQGNTVPVPKGFYYVGGTIDTGVVISDNEQDKYESGKDKTTHEYAPQLKGNQFVWIPCTIENYKKIDFGKENAKWDKETNISEYPQIEKYGGFYVGRYEAGVSTLNETTGQFEDSVTFTNNASLFNAVAIQSGINGWGWQNYNFIARGNVVPDSNYPNKATGNIVVKANSIPYYHADYYTAVEMTRRLYSNEYVRSGLVTGTEWDMMMEFLSDSSDYSDVKSTSWGNYNDTSLTNLRGYYTNVTSSGATDGFKTVEGTTQPLTKNAYILLTTGSTDQVMRKNLYDVAGNLWEWTQEASYVDNIDYNLNITYNSYMLRGGSFNNASAGDPACFRSGDYAPATRTLRGFRAVLYIK